MMRFLTVLTLVFSYGLLSCNAGYAQDTVQKKIGKLATQQVLSSCEECKVTVETKWMPSAVSRLDSSQIEQVQFREVGLPRGYQTVNISYQKDGQLRTYELQLFVKLKQKLPVVNKRIERNETIEAEDLAWKNKDITRLQKLPLTSKEEIVGQSVSNLIQKGDIVLQSDLQQLPIIKAGDNIKMVYSEGGVELALDCRARQAKAKGERIRVYSDKTRKTYLAKVVTSKKVIWEKTL